MAGISTKRDKLASEGGEVNEEVQIRGANMLNQVGLTGPLKIGT